MQLPKDVGQMIALIKGLNLDALARLARQSDLIPEQVLAVYAELITRGAERLIPPQAGEELEPASSAGGDLQRIDGHHRCSRW
jgi:hypothetical protein